MLAVSKISSGDFCIGRHNCCRIIYLTWLALICTGVQRIIYFIWPVRTIFRLFHVTLNTFSEVSGSGQFAMKWSYDPRLKHIFGFQLIYLVCLLLELHELNGDLLLPLSFLCYLNSFSFGCDTWPWLRNICPFYIFYLIVQIQVINL